MLTLTAEEQYNQVVTPSEVVSQNLKLQIHPILDQIGDRWVQGDPKDISVDLTYLQSDPILSRLLPNPLPAYDPKLDMDDDDDDSPKIRLVLLKDYKKIPFCAFDSACSTLGVVLTSVELSLVEIGVPRVTQARFEDAHLTIKNVKSVTLWEVLSKFSKM